MATSIDPIDFTPPEEAVWLEDEYGCLWINSTDPDCSIWLQARPWYCDRGEWLANLHPRGEFCREIDAADLWPRYYFDLVRAKAECEAWLAKRREMSKHRKRGNA